MAMLSPVRTRGQTAKSAATRSKALNRTARPQLLVKLKIPKKRILPEESPTVTDDAPTEAEEMLTEGGPSTVIGARKETLRVAVLPSIEKDEVLDQLKEVYDFMENAGLMDKFQQLPPAEDLTFVDINENLIALGRHRRKLFLGGDRSFFLWAYLRLHPKKSAEVILTIEPAIITHEAPANNSERVVMGMDFNGIHPMYPFRVLSQKVTDNARAGLNLLIQYYFLKGKEVDRVWSRNATHAKNSLKIVVNTVAKAYTNFPGGVQAVPNTYRPDNIPRGASDDHHLEPPMTTLTHDASARPERPSSMVPTFNQLLQDMERTSPTPHLEEGDGKSKRKAEDELERVLSLKKQLREEKRMAKEVTKRYKEFMAKQKRSMVAKKAMINDILETKQEADLRKFFLNELSDDEEDGEENV